MISFKGESFKIPSLSMEEPTKVRLQNLIILEHMCPKVGDYFTCYTTLMGTVIKTIIDVEILRRLGILYGKMKNDEAAHMFKSLLNMSKCDWFLMYFHLFLGWAALQWLNNVIGQSQLTLLIQCKLASCLKVLFLCKGTSIFLT